MTTAGSAASFLEVSRYYAGHTAVRSLSFELKPGRLTAFLGPNGAGKSTSIRILLGLESPAQGQVKVLGGSPRDREVRLRLGYTSQDLNFPAHLSGGEVLSWIGKHFLDPLPLSKLEKDFGLAGLMNKRLGNLSGGERRRVGLAGAFIGNPDLVVLDEPTTGLDLDAKESLWAHLKQYRDSGGTVLLCTHDLDEVEKVADDVLLLEKGERLFWGTLAETLNTIDCHKVTYVNAQGQRRVEMVKDSDRYLRDLVAKDRRAHNILVERASLEEAFNALRGKKGGAP